MPSFSLTRGDYADLQKRIVAQAKAQLRRGDGARAGGKGGPSNDDPGRWWLPLVLWGVSVVPLVFLFRWLESLPDMGTHLAMGAVGIVVGALAFWALVRSGSGSLQQAMFEDDGYCLAPQTLDVREDCIEQRSYAAHTLWQWAGFKHRQESETLVFLFVDNAVCLMVPKSILTPEARALIEQRVPLQAP
jgi:hypothetical protein